MDKRLRTRAIANDGVFSSADAAELGISGNQLTALVRAGEVIRVRHRAYIVSDAFEVADIATRYRLRVLAVMRSRPPEERASHQSALALFRLGFFGAPLGTVMIESPARPRTVAGITLHRPTSAPGRRFADVRCVSIAVACVQVAARYGFEAGVCAMDSALRSGRCTMADLEAAVEHVAAKWHSRVRLAVGFADARSESVGESRTRIILRDAGLTVVPQFEVREGRRLLGRADFLVDGLVVVEFDGMIKYSGADGRQALAAEKRRESEITRLGYEVVRIVWSDLDRPDAIVLRVMEARRVAEARRAAMAR